MHQLEQKLDELLVKKAPIQVPEAGRKALVEAMPWLALAGGIAMLLVAWWLYQTAAYVVDLANAYVYLTGYAPAINTFGPMLWVSLGLLVAEAILFFIAFPALRTRKKSGWNILFLVALVNAVQAIVQVIAYTNVGSLLGSFIGTVVGLYLLFQVRGYFTGEVTAARVNTTPTVKKPTAKT